MAHATVAAAAVAGGSNRSKPPPPPLTMNYPSQGYARRQSTMSSGSSNSDDEDEVYQSPMLSALDSSAALILVHDHDDSEQTNPFDFTEDEDEVDNDPDLVSPIFEARKSVVFPPLPPISVFLYLFAPLLKLGALDLPNSGLPLKYGLPTLLLSALASAFTRQVWYMLARYLRKADMSAVVVETFARGRGKERQRMVIRGLVRTGIGVVGMLLSVTYFRYSAYTLHPLVSAKYHPTLSYLLSSFLIGVLVAYLSYARSLNYRRIQYATWLSVVTYVAWLGCTIYAHSQGLLEPKSGWLGFGSVWQGLATTAFAFCSSSTLPLYASLKTTTPAISTAKAPRSRSFRLISFFSVLLAVLLLLPSVIFAAFPNEPAASSQSLSEQAPPPPPSTPDNITIVAALAVTSTINSTVIPAINSNSMHTLALPLPSHVALPTIPIETARRILSATTLLLGIPPMILCIPPPAIPSLRSVKFNVSRVLIIGIVLLLSMIPPRSFPSDNKEQKEGHADYYYLNSSGLSAVLTGMVLLMTLTSTYFVPAFIHVCIHFFKRPLAIVVPPRTPLLSTPSADLNNNNNGSSPHSSQQAVYDELLLRKERALQKRQSRKRIVWDIGIWVLLAASAAGVVVTAGGLFGLFR
ncbi:hypothetical protein CPC08DRAFT_707773 [Agrocybe pediades]|nr:hypothetical protein CPC08DRAFT_707773 [Agrocybe pediades]